MILLEVTALHFSRSGALGVKGMKGGNIIVAVIVAEARA
jgi:hypothetical protein